MTRSISSSLQHEGEYYCSVLQEGHEGITSNAVTALLAPERPVILRQPSPREVCPLNSKVVLTVIAKGHPKLNYQWFKGNGQLNGCTEPKLVASIFKNS